MCSRETRDESQNFHLEIHIAPLPLSARQAEVTRFLLPHYVIDNLGLLFARVV